jgi:hypothetical protein
LGPSLLDGSGGLNAVEDRHSHIHNDYIGLLALNHLDHFGPVSCFPNNRHDRGRIEQRSERPARPCSVVSENDPDIPPRGDLHPAIHYSPILLL